MPAGHASWPAWILPAARCLLSCVHISCSDPRLLPAPAPTLTSTSPPPSAACWLACGPCPTATAPWPAPLPRAETWRPWLESRAWGSAPQCTMCRRSPTPPRAACATRWVGRAKGATSGDDRDAPRRVWEGGGGGRGRHGDVRLRRRGRYGLGVAATLPALPSCTWLQPTAILLLSPRSPGRSCTRSPCNKRWPLVTRRAAGGTTWTTSWPSCWGL